MKNTVLAMVIMAAAVAPTTAWAAPSSGSGAFQVRVCAYLNDTPLNPNPTSFQQRFRAALQSFFGC